MFNYRTFNDRDGVTDGLVVAKVRAEPHFRRWKGFCWLLSDKHSQGVEKQFLAIACKLTSNFVAVMGDFEMSSEKRDDNRIGG